MAGPVRTFNCVFRADTLAVDKNFAIRAYRLADQAVIDLSSWAASIANFAGARKVMAFGTAVERCLRATKKVQSLQAASKVLLVAGQSRNGTRCSTALACSACKPGITVGIIVLNLVVGDDHIRANFECRDILLVRLGLNGGGLEEEDQQAELRRLHFEELRVMVLIEQCSR